MDSTLLQSVEDAVTARFMMIRARLVQRKGDYIYGGHRTAPGELGWRFRQTLALKRGEDGGLTWACYPELPAEITRGEHDATIEATWHDAGSAEWYYKNEKDYGRDDPEPEEDDESEEDW